MTAIHSDQTPVNLTGALWTRYRSTGDVVARAQLLDRYLGLVHHVAREVGARTPAVELEELVSAGTIGLVRALDSFDLARGLAFSTYAVRRIRSRDWIPRSVRAKSRKLIAATATLQAQLGRAPQAREVAATLEIDLETYWKWRGAVDGGVMVSFDGAAMPGERSTLALEETIDDPEAPLPGQALDRVEQVEGLKRAMVELSEY